MQASYSKTAGDVTGNIAMLLAACVLHASSALPNHDNSQALELLQPGQSVQRLQSVALQEERLEIDVVLQVSYVCEAFKVQVELVVQVRGPVQLVLSAQVPQRLLGHLHLKYFVVKDQ
jgi:hypothetical protein